MNRFDMSIEIYNGRLLLENGTLCRENIFLEGDRITRIGAEASRSGGRFNAGGMLVLPGIVDIHGDAFERQLMPRPEVFFPYEIALHDTDIQMVANGITTGYHGLTYSWEPGLRGADAARAFLSALETEKKHLVCDTRVHLRFETYNLKAVGEAVEWIEKDKIGLLGFNDHTECFWNEIAIPRYATVLEARTGLTNGEYRALLERVRSWADMVPAAIDRLSTEARERGIPMASHDDETPQMRRSYHSLGCTLCEFPVTFDTVMTARELEDLVILGAPNAFRGQSQSSRRVSARDAIENNACNVLTSDYYYPALLQSAFALARDGVLSFPKAWSLVSANPARAVGLTDRGCVAPGKRADLVLVDDSIPTRPRVCNVFAAGRLVLSCGNLLPGANGTQTCIPRA
jgi:alpha-D-ribose 1-methylphosphonate 5-triphosphate diphosphatase